MFPRLSMGVSIGPGATALIGMSGANSRIQDRVSPIAVAFKAQYAQWSAREMGVLDGYIWPIV